MTTLYYGPAEQLGTVREAFPNAQPGLPAAVGPSPQVLVSVGADGFADLAYVLASAGEQMKGGLRGILLFDPCWRGPGVESVVGTGNPLAHLAARAARHAPTELWVLIECSPRLKSCFGCGVAAQPCQVCAGAVTSSAEVAWHLSGRRSMRRGGLWMEGGLVIITHPDRSDIDGVALGPAVARLARNVGAS